METRMPAPSTAGGETDLSATVRVIAKDQFNGAQASHDR